MKTTTSSHSLFNENHLLTITTHSTFPPALPAQGPSLRLVPWEPDTTDCITREPLLSASCLCQLETQQEIKELEKEKSGVLLPISPPSLHRAPDSVPLQACPHDGPLPISTCHQAPASPYRPTSGNGFSLLLVPGCFSSPLSSPAPAHASTNKPFIKLAFKSQP